MRKIKSILILGVILLIACVDYAKEDLVLDSECYYCPETVTLLFPLNNETCEPGELIDDSRAIIKLLWEESSNTDYYEVSVIDLSSGESQTISNVLMNEQEVVLIRSRVYEWSVTSVNQRSDTTSTSEVFQFYLEGEQTDNIAPTTPILLTPESGKTIDAGEKLFSWESSSDADGDNLLYTLYLDTIDGKQEPPVEQRAIVANSILRLLEPGLQYYYRVEVSDGQIISSSETRSFRTRE
jgi:hypothetical protein